MGYDDFDSEALDHSPSQMDLHNLQRSSRRQKNFNMGVISVTLPEGFVL
jgi:hypothetical protein